MHSTSIPAPHLLTHTPHPATHTALPQVFPFQRNALDFADWANTAPPDALRRLARETATNNFPSFAQRWAVLERHMRQHPPPQLPTHPHPTTGDAAGAAGAGVDGGGRVCSGGAQRGAAVGPPEPVRVFVEEYAGRHGFTRHFVATTYKVRGNELRQANGKSRNGLGRIWMCQ